VRDKRQLHHPLLDREPRSEWAAQPRFHQPWRRRYPDPTGNLSCGDFLRWRCCARSWWETAASTCSSASSRRRPHVCDRDEPTTPRVSSPRRWPRSDRFPLAKVRPNSRSAATRGLDRQRNQSPNPAVATPKHRSNRLIDYVVVKFRALRREIPRRLPPLTTSMKSSATLWRSGRTFQEILRMRCAGVKPGSPASTRSKFDGLPHDDKNRIPRGAWALRRRT